ncbi:MAG: phytanoyl-CoA dioxygenase family protein [Acidobacteria bacterium]|nr:phytanoyl-CoA dioxygenase family protein [Acidobacteriota bacterium]
MKTLQQEIEQNGFAIRESVFSMQEIEELIVESNRIQQQEDQKRGGVRDLLRKSAKFKALAISSRIHELVKPVLGAHAHVVRAILFDKTEAANWKVPWHQDVTIAVRKRYDIDSFGPWSVKDGVLHVQPPTHVMENMLTVRVHLDDCPEENGALKVIPSSHKEGKISAVEVEERAALATATICEVNAGGALLMRPLLFHASSSSNRPGHRRVLHFDYSAAKLPQGLAWLEAAPFAVNG